MFTRAIVRKPAATLAAGLTTADLGPPDYALALAQHEAYRQALIRCGLEVTCLPADDAYPDSTFVEDTALITPECAIIMRPGAESRRGEAAAMESIVRGLMQNVHRVESPGTADAGDIMAIGRHYYIGISERTNDAGARQIIDILRSHGMAGSLLTVQQGLHLKSSASYLENGNVLVAGDFKSSPELARLNQIPVDDEERYAANSVWVNGCVLVPSGYPRTEKAIRSRGYETMALDVSEFRKLDGGLSCLSLRF